jgi:hypothetical protein
MGEVMIRKLFLIAVVGFSFSSLAQEAMPAPVSDTSANPSGREPAQDSIPGRKANDEELRVAARLPEAQAKKDMRSIQLEVYKSLFNKELKPDQREDVEE